MSGGFEKKTITAKIRPEFKILGSEIKEQENLYCVCLSVCLSVHKRAGKLVVC